MRIDYELIPGQDHSSSVDPEQKIVSCTTFQSDNKPGTTMFKKYLVTALGLAVIGTNAYASDSGSSFALGVAPSYSDGKYGTTSDTKILYLPVYAKYQLDDFSLKLTVPYIVETGTGTTMISGGMVIGRGPKRTSTTTTESGLGDVWLEGRYRFHGAGFIPDVIPYAKVKFATASSSNGLGTGQTDYEGGLGLEWAVGNWFPFADGGYRVIGNPPGTILNNIATYDAGVMYQIGKSNFLTGMFMGHQSTEPGFPAAADAIASFSHQTASHFTYQVFVDKGLSDASPNFAVGVGVEKRF